MAVKVLTLQVTFATIITRQPFENRKPTSEFCPMIILSKVGQIPDPKMKKKSSCFQLFLFCHIAGTLTVQMYFFFFNKLLVERKVSGYIIDY